MTYLVDTSVPIPEHQRIAFAIPRKVGNAVQRNRLRRVIRARLTNRMTDHEPRVGPGAYLIAVRPGADPLEPRVAADLVEGCLDDLWVRR